ncbi:MAG: hypothetical protein Q7J16_01510 [Candidatus Cloacimonadales bacterium]|nr:hypothetical protein [Candidatus Cloacimonadales bacterium]
MKNIMILSLMLVLIGSMYALESAPSEVVGFVKYGCVSTTGTNLNLVALPLETGYTMASDLGNAIGADVVNVWDAAGQGWLSASNLGFMWVDDFALQDGYTYLVNILADTDVYIVGSLIIQLGYNLITTTGTNLNLIMCPMNRSDLTMASELGNDIGVCDVVNKWDAAGQGWLSASNLGFMWVDDFAVDIADPLMVNVTSDTVWPSGEGDNKVSQKPAKVRK